MTFGLTRVCADVDELLTTYRSVWRGEPVGGGDNAAVPPGTRQVPMLFGGFAPAALGPASRSADDLKPVAILVTEGEHGRRLACG